MFCLYLPAFTLFLNVLIKCDLHSCDLPVFFSLYNTILTRCDLYSKKYGIAKRLVTCRKYLYRLTNAICSILIVFIMRQTIRKKRGVSSKTILVIVLGKHGLTIRHFRERKCVIRVKEWEISQWTEDIRSVVAFMPVRPGGLTSACRQWDTTCLTPWTFLMAWLISRRSSFSSKTIWKRKRDFTTGTCVAYWVLWEHVVTCYLKIIVFAGF